METLLTPLVQGLVFGCGTAVTFGIVMLAEWLIKETFKHRGGGNPLLHWGIQCFYAMQKKYSIYWSKTQ